MKWKEDRAFRVAKKSKYSSAGRAAQAAALAPLPLRIVISSYAQNKYDAS